MPKVTHHKHRIVPKHMGGTDDTNNMVVLTIEEHAEAHRKLYERYGKEEDKIAWLRMSGIEKLITENNGDCVSTTIEHTRRNIDFSK